MYRTIPCALVAVALLAAEIPGKLPYSEDAVPQKEFNVEGVWRLDEIAGFAKVEHLNRRQRRRLIGTSLQIQREKAVFFNKKVMPWKRPFPTPVIGENTYDSGSREFWFDFETDPKTLKLPRYVTAVDVELGSVLFASADRVLFDYQGVWYRITRTSETAHVQ